MAAEDPVWTTGGVFRTRSELNGFAATIKWLTSTQMRFADEMDTITKNFAQEILEESKRLCPISPRGSYPKGQSKASGGKRNKPGFLRASGRLVRGMLSSPGRVRKTLYTTPEAGAVESITYAIMFSAFYAVYVHEKPATHTPPTQWKFIEQAIKNVTAFQSARLIVWGMGTGRPPRGTKSPEGQEFNPFPRVVTTRTF